MTGETLAGIGRNTGIGLVSAGILFLQACGEGTGDRPATVEEDVAAEPDALETAAVERGGTAEPAAVAALPDTWNPEGPSPTEIENDGHVPPEEFVGVKRCAECHEQAYEDWKLSDHFRSMEVATEETVLGDFNDVEFEHFGWKTRFYRKEDGTFWVNTANIDGEPTDYKVEYTFGYYPLQQYLVRFPGGRMQVLQVCWNTFPEEEGGQRWFHLYPDEEIPPDDILHWTRQHFNWNYMCANCHSTNLRKNYDFETDTYHTRWNEINVSCETCHGPGRRHSEEAEIYEKTGEWKSEDFGLAVRLKEPEEGTWMIDPETMKPKRSKPLASTIQVDTCAPCHSHRRPLVDGWAPYAHYGDAYSVTLLDKILYHADGQIKEEVYVYGSFLQSRMFQNHVRCTDCHHPHTMKTLAPGNVLCIRCHAAHLYDTPDHHFHEVGSAGASCVECHMPEQNYMVVDPRRDHSMRSPRPDFTKATGAPNACSNCHDNEEETLEWVMEWFEKWYPGVMETPHYGDALESEEIPDLVALVEDKEKPGYVRASALAAMGRQAATRESLTALARSLKDEDPVVREAAIENLAPLEEAQRLQFGADLLSDPVKSVRVAAVRGLASVPKEMFSDEQRKAFDAALEELIAVQMVISDRPGGHMGLGLIYADLGELEKAEEAYRNAFRVDPDNYQSRVNLAEMLFRQGRTQESQALLEDAVAVAPDQGITHEALARHWIRRKDYEEGLKHLLKAAELTPEGPEVQFFTGVALNQMGRFEEALPYLKKAVELAPRNREYLSGLVAICRDHGNWDTAIEYAEKLVELYPEEPGWGRLLEQLKEAAGR